MAELWLIEAVGKRPVLERTLDAMGRTAVVYATVGHVRRHDDRLGLGISLDLSEPGRIPVDPKVEAKVRELAAEADIIYAATDADQAGDMIACDLADIGGEVSRAPVRRVRLAGLDKVSVEAALDQAGRIDYRQAAPGRAKRIIDRLLMATYAQPGLAIGRRQTALLAAVDRDEQIGSLARYVIVAPAADGGTPFSLEIGPDATIGKADLDRLLTDGIRPVRPGDFAHIGFAPKHFGDVLVSLSDVATRADNPASIPHLANACQDLYMTGRLSYPRSSKRGFSEQTVTRITRGLPSFGAEVVANPNAIVAADAGGAHDAPHPIGAVMTDVTPGLGTPEGILAEVGNAALRAAHLWPGQIPDRDDLRRALIEAGLAREVARALASRRWIRWDGAPPPGMTKPMKSSMFLRAADAGLLDLAVAAGIGTPSSWPDMIAQATGPQATVKAGPDGRLVLTELGRASLAAAPEFLKDPEFSSKLDSWLGAKLERGPEPWRQLAISVMRQMPQDARDRMRKTLATAQPAQKVTMESLGIDTKERRDPRNAPVHAPAPRSAY